MYIYGHIYNVNDFYFQFPGDESYRDANMYFVNLTHGSLIVMDGCMQEDWLVLSFKNYNIFVLGRILVLLLLSIQMNFVKGPILLFELFMMWSQNGPNFVLDQLMLLMLFNVRIVEYYASFSFFSFCALCIRRVFELVEHFMPK